MSIFYEPPDWGVLLQPSGGTRTGQGLGRNRKAEKSRCFLWYGLFLLLFISLLVSQAQEIKS